LPESSTPFRLTLELKKTKTHREEGKGKSRGPMGKGARNHQLRPGEGKGPSLAKKVEQEKRVRIRSLLSLVISRTKEKKRHSEGTRNPEDRKSEGDSRG